VLVRLLLPSTLALDAECVVNVMRTTECMENAELLAIVGSLPPGSGESAAACELLVSRHRYLVWSEVRRYLSSPESADDLMQVGYVGLVKAIRNFDPDLGGSLPAFARPCISGEIKRYFRDKRWPIHVQRSVQDLVVQVRAASGQLTQDLGRMPAESDLAVYLGVSGGELREARRAELAFQPGSLDAPIGGESGIGSLADLLGDEDPRIELMLGMRAVAAHWHELPQREQKILAMRFYEDMTQAQIGKQLGLSQMHVSRLIARALGYLRPRLLGFQDLPVSAVPLSKSAVPLGNGVLVATGNRPG
jgi:RNA polymerase sigma-B factor